ncbi:membrane protein [Virgisporangium aliadipatigenens]|uniref:Membrane protein n=2 Tax=Virgisporangium aliadipatigenens TaxID=741659 RepID=A0A8J4DQM6_9ACTN|nr:glycosyltransferase 87 family protein [Virgisporangium aliadipatigenens]GIJ45883.1 membrane protein [Virgisporangium aliadipatigenens]
MTTQRVPAPEGVDAGRTGAVMRLRHPSPTAKRIGVVAALFLCALVFDAFFAVRHAWFDMQVYYGALNYWVDGTGEIYDYLLTNTKYGFTYPPFAALLMIPMAFLEWNLAVFISVSMTVIGAVAVLYWLTKPLAKRLGQPAWFVLGVAAALAVAFEPMRETFLFGQVNSVLLVLVAGDLLLLVRNNRSVAGVGIGIATAIKLTPGVFIVYLIVTRRYRAAVVASGTTAAATLFAGAVAPDATREFWTDALWNTSRVGSQSFVSNQALSGLTNRWDPSQPSKLVWIALVLAVLAVWAWRSHRAVQRGDEASGLAFTGALGVLISPISWVHHLVWVMPALVLLVVRAFDPGVSKRRRNWLIGTAAVTYMIMCSRLVWAFNGKFDTFAGWVGSNAYVWLSLMLLVVLPLAPVARPKSEAASAEKIEAEPELPAPAATVTVPAPARRLVGADQQ